MKKLICSLAALPFLADAALAQPIQLTDRHMDRVSAGETLASIQISPSLVPGGSLVAKVQADAILAGVINQYLGPLTPRLAIAVVVGPIPFALK